MHCLALLAAHPSEVKRICCVMQSYCRGTGIEYLISWTLCAPSSHHRRRKTCLQFSKGLLSTSTILTRRTRCVHLSRYWITCFHYMQGLLIFTSLTIATGIEEEESRWSMLTWRHFKVQMERYSLWWAHTMNMRFHTTKKMEVRSWYWWLSTMHN